MTHATNVEMDEPAIIVSCDSHAGPKLMEQLRAYCPQQYLEQFDEDAAAQAKQAEGMRSAMSARMSHPNLDLDGHWDPQARSARHGQRRRRRRADLALLPERREPPVDRAGARHRVQAPARAGRGRVRDLQPVARRLLLGGRRAAARSRLHPELGHRRVDQDARVGARERVALPELPRAEPSRREGVQRSRVGPVLVRVHRPRLRALDALERRPVLRLHARARRHADHRLRGWELAGRAAACGSSPTARCSSVTPSSSS